MQLTGWEILDLLPESERKMLTDAMHDQAEEEEDIIYYILNDTYYEFETFVSHLFIWAATPQGHDFWDSYSYSKTFNDLTSGKLWIKKQIKLVTME